MVGTRTDFPSPMKRAVGGAIGRSYGKYLFDARFNGDIAEVVIFDVALTASERQQMDAYFKAHWQL
jgi:hypothetical protein